MLSLHLSSLARTQQRSPWGGLGGLRGERREPRRCRLNVARKSRDLRPRSVGLALSEMTINVGLVTSDAVILGCDSVASTTSHFLEPFSKDWTKVEGADNKFTITFDYNDFKSIVTNAWGGVTKLFEIHPLPSPVAAVTAGLAKLNDRPVASIAAEFCAKQTKRTKHLIKVDVIAKAFLEHMRAEYERHYHGSNLPDLLKDGPEFLVGGYGRDDDFPTIYRIDVQKNTVVEDFGPNASSGRTGIAWNGQSDAVERFIRGYNYEAKASIEMAIRQKLTSFNKENAEYVTGLINSILDKLGAKLPDEIQISLPEVNKVDINWEDFRIDLDYANLPLQEAVNFVAFLVNVQGGRSRFARGVPTVGGRTHIGVITKQGLRMLNEPDLSHRNTGFSDDQ